MIYSYDYIAFYIGKRVFCLPDEVREMPSKRLIGDLFKEVVGKTIRQKMRVILKLLQDSALVLTFHEIPEGILDSTIGTELGWRRKSMKQVPSVVRGEDDVLIKNYEFEFCETELND